MMNCNEIENKLGLFSSEEYTENEKRALEVHLAECPSCQRKYSMIQRLEHIIVAEKEEKVNPFLSTRVISKWQESKRESSKAAFGRRVLQPALIGVMMLVGIAIGLTFALQFTESPSDKTIRELSYYMDGVHQEKIETLLLEL